MKRALKIRMDRPGYWRVWLNDHEVSDFLTGVTLAFDANEAIPAAELHLLVTEVDIDTVALTHLQAHVIDTGAA